MKLHSKSYIIIFIPDCSILCQNISFRKIQLRTLFKILFIPLWKNRKELRSDTNLNAWLYTVAKNNCLKKLRDEKYRKEIFKSVQIDAFELELNIWRN